VCHFLAQVLHESEMFTRFEENLNYSSERLMTVFPKHFQSKKIADEYAHKPEKIANRIYANRMGNGDEQSGDGWKYRGMGPIQLTGKETQLMYFHEFRDIQPLRIDGLADPKNEDCWFSAGWYWKKNRLNPIADQDSKENTIMVSKIVNGGINGLSERIALVEKLKSIIPENLNPQNA